MGQVGGGRNRELPPSFPGTPSAIPKGTAPKDVMKTGFSHCLQLCASTAPFLSAQAALTAPVSAARTGPEGQVTKGRKERDPLLLAQAFPWLPCFLPVPSFGHHPARQDTGWFAATILGVSDGGRDRSLGAFPIWAAEVGAGRDGCWEEEEGSGRDQGVNPAQADYTK